MATKKEVELMAHLMRRAGFGAARDEIEAYASKGYEATVDELIAATDTSSMPDDLIRRYHAEQSAMMSRFGPPPYWLYTIATTRAPLREKAALLWHRIFATGYSKTTQGKVVMDQIRMFQRHGLGSFKTLLVELSKDPAMIVWLDNQDNHKGAINENFGRELLELFSMGVGNYTEQDIKECARAFTGWTLANTDYMAVRARRDSIWPYGRIAWHFEYRPEDHDDGEKEFLGQRGRFNGEEIVEIICQQQATAAFIARHTYSFFVADEPPVPQWPYTPPRDPEAIEVLTEAYFDSDYEIRAMLRTLFNSDFFKSEECWYEKMKSPVELVAGVVRLTGEFDRPRREILDRSLQMIYMGQHLGDPVSVEGWQGGTDWIDTGTLVERLNFASQQMGDADKPGVRAMAERVLSGNGGKMSPERLVDGCLDQLGAIRVSEETRSALVEFTSADQGSGSEAQRTVEKVLQLAATSREFQRA